MGPSAKLPFPLSPDSKSHLPLGVLPSLQAGETTPERSNHFHQSPRALASSCPLTNSFQQLALSRHTACSLGDSSHLHCSVAPCPQTSDGGQASPPPQAPHCASARQVICLFPSFTEV